MPKKPLWKPWPKLSETLPHHTRLQCNRCLALRDLTHWCECDEGDRVTMVFVVLCQRCADELIDPHPRLYVSMLATELMPGAMQICDDCQFRNRLGCVSPERKAAGGDGLSFDPLIRTHLCSRGKGLSGWHFFIPDDEQLRLAGGFKCSGKKQACPDERQ